MAPNTIHPDLTAVRAVDACGGEYTAEEIASGWAEGHNAAICAAMKAVVDADALTAELLTALRRARRYVADLPIVGDADLAIIDAVIAKATGAE